jgi:hypothetical protein
MRTSLLPTSSRKIISACSRKPIPRLFPVMSTGVPSETAQIQQQSNMSTSSTPSASDLGIESDIKTATGVSLSSQQKVIVGSILDVSEIKSQTKIRYILVSEIIKGRKKNTDEYTSYSPANPP